jgi:hypothetical protein
MSDAVPRVEYGLDNDAYRAAPGLSHSDSKRLRKSPWHFKALTEPRDPQLAKAPTPQMALGTMVHTATLEPNAFDLRYLIGPDVSKNSNRWREFAAACESAGAEPITQQQREQAFAMAASVRALPDFAALIEHCATEVSLWWECEKTGLLCKARPDLVKHYPQGVILADLKTTQDASAESFARSVADFSYHTQAHWYSEGAAAALGVPVLSFLFAVVESEYPYAAASYTLDDNAMSVAADINLSTRELYLRCMQANEWPGYPRETSDISLPPWYMRRFLAGLPS